MEFVLLCCVLYCISMTIVCGIFAFSETLFKGKPVPDDCFSANQMSYPVDSIASGAINVSKNMASCMKFGFAVHFVGMFADMSMVIRVRS